MQTDWNDIQTARALLRQHGCIAHIWSLADVHAVAGARGRALTNAAAMAVLERMERCTDSEYGLTWLTLDHCLDEVLEEAG